MTEQIPITIIGGGVVGCAVAYELSKSLDQDIVLIERNKDIPGENQSSRNSEVIHAGIYYEKETEPLKARFCVEGNALLYDFSEEFNVPHKKTGKLVVATNPLEDEYLDDLVKTAIENGVNVKEISGEEAKEYEPNVNVFTAIHVPSSGIIDASLLVTRLRYFAKQNDVATALNSKVLQIIPKNGYFEVVASDPNNDGKILTIETKLLINAAGLYSDEIARMVSPESPYLMEPVRGESAKFNKTRREELWMNGLNVYPAPYGFYNDTGKKAEVCFERYKELLKQGRVTRTLGVHLTPKFEEVDNEYAVGGIVSIGPTTTVGKGKEDYKSDLHPTEHYFERVKHFFPGLRLEDIKLSDSGIRAKLKDHKDFVIERDPKHPNCINLIGIDSPGLTASLAIAKYVREMVRQ